MFSGRTLFFLWNYMLIFERFTHAFIIQFTYYHIDMYLYIYTHLVPGQTGSLRERPDKGYANNHMSQQLARAKRKKRQQQLTALSTSIAAMQEGAVTPLAAGQTDPPIYTYIYIFIYTCLRI